MGSRLAGKVCLITGATGIAAAAAELFASEGASLFVVSLRAADCEALAQQIGSGAPFAWAEADLTHEDEVERAFASCQEHYGRLDATFASAGGSGRTFGDTSIHLTSLKSFDDTVALNLTSSFLTARESIKIMLQQAQGGSIVFVSSVAATHPVPGTFDTIAYAAAKGGINALTLHGASHYGASGIRFNTIAPALTLTPMAKRAASDPDTIDVMKQRMGLTGGGPLSADDHANLALFLCSDESRHITGQIICVDGGWGVS